MQKLCDGPCAPPKSVDGCSPRSQPLCSPVCFTSQVYFPHYLMVSGARVAGEPYLHCAPCNRGDG